MACLVIWDQVTGEIVSSRIPPSGSAPAPTLDNCFPFDEDRHTKYDSAWTEHSFLAQQAKENLRVKDGAIYSKPVADVSVDKEKFVADGVDEVTVTITLSNLKDFDTVNEIEVTVTGVEPAQVPVVGGAAEFEIATTVSGDYRVEVTDQRFRPGSMITVKGVEPGEG